MEIKLANILFLDIETISVEANFDLLGDRLKEAWLKKAGNLKNEEGLSLEAMFEKRAAIYAEFGKILCIGIGGIYDLKTPKLKTKTLSANSEKAILEEFKEIVEKHPAKDQLQFCAHNGKEFDLPYICRRMLINNISLPNVLNFSNKKPWEIKHFDTLEMWKFGDYKNYTSLELLATVFDIATSKTTIDGSMVNETFYKNNDLKTILNYCQEDVVVLCQLFLKLVGKSTILEKNIIRANY